MKNTISRYLNVGKWFDKFAIYQTGSLIEIESSEQSSSKWKSTLCLFEQKSYWKATRQYRGSHPLDLYKIFNAEKKNISPFPAKVFWKITRINFNFVEVTFYCLPLKDWQKLPTHLKFFMPLDFLKETDLELSTSKTFDKSSFNLAAVKLVPAYSLLGCFSRRLAEKDKHKVINYKHFILSLCAVIAVYISCSSLYLWSAEYFVNKSIETNKDASIELVQQERKVKKLVSDLEKLKVYKDNSTDVLSLLASIKVDTESTTFNRIQAASDFITIWGETEGSATQVLEALVAHPMLKDVKFSSPVHKGRLGKEAFVIEAMKK
ncbi:hypothetical protein L0668_09995 [Paraglaciecola aquimarina]|uniref:Uncharacterized protein n=1 Tax=Paraglaciecola algarum TaxID=3050085 RepID=A0ABS9D688_9ALTE|nr:hypothetical protein [Paraglaciecola sp. G1-23]MCF2948438.1 hypothetical protein [Paraglaciecola sp. G1-23]